jgi:hypothetical protein
VFAVNPWHYLPLALLGLLVLAHPAGAQTPEPPGEGVVIATMRSFRIPFRIEPGPSTLSEIELYCSTDEGKTWRKCATASPEQCAFECFTAPQDGLYWFAARSLDMAGRARLMEVGLKVLVDTRTPLAQLPPPGMPQPVSVPLPGSDWDQTGNVFPWGETVPRPPVSQPAPAAALRQTSRPSCQTNLTVCIPGAARLSLRVEWVWPSKSLPEANAPPR